MTLIAHVYLDESLTDQFDDASDLLEAAAVDGTDSADGVFWVGDPDDTIKLQASSDPGVDPIAVSIVDASPGGGVEASHIKLAATQALLDSATGGATLNLPATINGGTAGAQPVWYRWSNSTGDGISTEISLSIVARSEVAI